MSKTASLSVDEDLIKRLPLPLAQICRRAQNAKSCLEQHQAAYYFWEISLKLLASTALVEYADLGDDDPQLAERLQNLARPSLGHWWEFVRRLVPILADRGDAGFKAIRDLLFSRARGDLPRCCGLDAAFRGLLDQQEGARSTVRLSELFDRLVQYRNQELGHGALGQKPRSYYERMSAALMGAMGELFGRLDVLAGRRIVHIADVRRQSGGQWLVERLELAGEAARRIESLELGEAAVAHLPRPDLLYLEEPAATPAPAPAVLRALHPLVLFEPEAGEVFFLNAQKGKKDADFLCYHSGRVICQDVFRGDRRDLFLKIFGASADAETLATWSAQSLATEGPPPADEPLDRARTLGEFELLSKIDQGGMGVVYRAWQPSLGRPVALKALLRVGDPKSEARFAREIKALGRVEHPHLVKIFTSGADGDHWFYAMELVEGANLASICSQLAQAGATDVGELEWRQATSAAWERARSAEQVLSAEGPPLQAPPSSSAPVATMPEAAAVRSSQGHVHQVAEIMRQVALAAHALHEAGVVHRDIKPGNIMMTLDDRRAVLMDLGLAQLADDTDGRLTKTRQFVGTLRYASPEQLLASGVDRRSDIYGMGATLWELLTFRPLFEATEDMPSPELMHRIQTRSPERPRKLNPRVPRDLETLVLKCLEKDPRNRYATAQDLADDLGRFLHGEPVRAQPPTPGYLLAKYVQKNKARIGAIAAGLVLLLLGVVFAFVQISRARNLAVAALAGEAEAHRRVAAHLQAERKARQDLAAKQQELQHRLAENYLQAGINDCLIGQAGLGLSSILAAYDAAPADDPIRRSARMLMAGWERTLAIRVLHDEAIEAVGFHPAGHMIMTASRDRTVRFWDTQTGMPLGKPLRTTGTIWAAGFSPQGDLLATGDDERGVILWDVAARQPHGAPLAHAKAVRALAFSPDGTHLATGCQDTFARLWDVATQKLSGAPLPHNGEVLAVAFSPDGDTLATGGEDANLRFWNAHTGEPVGAPIAHDDAVWTVAYTRDGTFLFTGSWSGQGRLYDATSRQLVSDAIRHKEGILGAVFTPDGQKLLVGSRDNTAQFWDVKKGTRIGPCYEHLRSIRAVALGPDGQDFMTGSRDCEARLYKEFQLRPIGAPFTHPGPVPACAVSADGRRLATACQDGAARLWDLAGGQALGKAMKHEGPVTALAFSADGRTLVTGSEDKTIRQWHATTGEPAAELIPFRDVVTSLALFPGESLALVGGLDRSARCIDLATGKPHQEPLRHDAAVAAVAVLPGGRRFVTAGQDRVIRLWDRTSWLPVGPVMRHNDGVLALAVDAAGKFLASSSADNTARLWDLSQQTLERELVAHDRDVVAVAISPDGHLILTGGEDKATRLWDAYAGKPIGEPIVHDSMVRAVAFTPDGTRYLVAQESGVVEVWPTPQPLPEEPPRITAWIHARTSWTHGDRGLHRRLTVEEWTTSWKRLAELGGPFAVGHGP